jgi:hypothetical protein
MLALRGEKVKRATYRTVEPALVVQRLHLVNGQMPGLVVQAFLGQLFGEGALDV